LQVLLYQGSIFYAQYVEGTQDLIDPEDLTPEVQTAYSDVKCFLIIEIVAFYTIILGTIFFLFLEQFSSIINEKRQKESGRNEEDIILYSQRTLEWQGFNYILMLTPCILISFES